MTILPMHESHHMNASTKSAYAAFSLFKVDFFILSFA
jgi:hypothetical protein